MTDTTQGATIEHGSCYVVFAYDAARSLNLDAAEIRIQDVSQRQTFSHKRRAPSYFEYQPPPLRISRDSEPIAIGKFTTRTTVDIMGFGFGAVAAIYAISIAGAFEDLLHLSEDLYDNESLLADS